MPATKPKTVTLATLANSSGKAGGKAQKNKGGGGTSKGAKAATATAKNRGKGGGVSKNSSTASRPRPGLSAKAVTALQRQGAAMERARLASAGRLVEANKKGSSKSGKGKGKNRKHKNGTPGFLARITRNPNVGDVVQTAKTGGLGLAGFAFSRIIAAIVLAIGDRFLPNWTRMKYASPVITFVAAIVAVPLVFGSLLKVASRQSQDAMTGGGIMGAFGEAFAIAAGRDVISETVDAVRDGANRLLPGGAGAGAGAGGNGGGGTVAGIRRAPVRRAPSNVGYIPPRGGRGGWPNAYTVGAR